MTTSTKCSDTPAAWISTTVSFRKFEKLYKILIYFWQSETFFRKLFTKMKREMRRFRSQFVLIFRRYDPVDARHELWRGGRRSSLGLADLHWVRILSEHLFVHEWTLVRWSQQSALQVRILNDILILRKLVDFIDNRLVSDLFINVEFSRLNEKISAFFQFTINRCWI